jgi:hypothetical protein
LLEMVTDWDEVLFVNCKNGGGVRDGHDDFSFWVLRKTPRGSGRLVLPALR